MSISLPTLDLTGLTVGQSIALTGLPLTSPEVVKRSQSSAKLAYFNDTGFGLIGLLQSSNSSFSIPPGAWGSVVLDEKDTQLLLTVVYILPGSPIAKFLSTYYYPTEALSPSSKLGNSPISIGGTVQVSSISTLSNEGNAAGTLVVDIGPSGLSSIVAIYTDHFTWSVDQAGVSHTVLQGQSSGNPLLIGKSGDISEILGNLNIDGTLLTLGASSLSGTLGVSGAATLSGGLSSTNAAQTITGNANGSLHLGQAAAGDTLDTTSGTSGNTYLKTPNATGLIVLQVPNGTEIGHWASDGLHLGSGKDIFVGGTLRYQLGTTTRLSSFSGTGSGTFATGLGVGPTQITANPCTVSGSSQTIGLTNADSTVVTTGAGLAWGGVAYHN